MAVSEKLKSWLPGSPSAKHRKRRRDARLMERREVVSFETLDPRMLLAANLLAKHGLPASEGLDSPAATSTTLAHLAAAAHGPLPSALQTRISLDANGVVSTETAATRTWHHSRSWC